MKKLYTEKRACCGCCGCKDACPADAIRMVSDKEGFLYPDIDDKLCIGCKRCEQVCPFKIEGKEKNENTYFGIQAKEDTVRCGSSSGGIFPLLAEYVLRQGGVVYGAAYDEEMKVVHREAHDRETLEGLKRTKYVQSDPDGVYRRIEEQLKAEQWVLFCGTPCQAHALKLFLNHPYPKLLVVALVCYGVSSPGIWQLYVRYLEYRRGGKMTDFSFRDKRNRDNGHTCAYVTGGTEYSGPLHENLYFRMYSGNYALRPSCHDCRFCTVERECDFTIGDFWGIERVRPDMDDGMGTSMVILHTDKAREIWELVKKDGIWFACEKEDILQPRLREPTAAAERRGFFMALYEAFPFPLFLFLFRLWIFGAALAGRLRKRIRFHS